MRRNTITLLSPCGVLQGEVPAGPNPSSIWLLLSIWSAAAQEPEVIWDVLYPRLCSVLLPHTLSSPHALAAGCGAGHPVSHPPVTPYQQAVVCRGRPSQLQVSTDALCTGTVCVCPGSFRWPGDRALALTGQHHELLHHSVAGSTHSSMRPESPSQSVLPQLQFIFILALLSSLCLYSVAPV